MKKTPRRITDIIAVGGLIALMLVLVSYIRGWRPVGAERKKM